MKTIAACALLLTTAASAAASYPAGSAQQRTADAISRIQAIDLQLHSVIALDPTAMDHARALDQMSRTPGPLFGEPVLLKDNIEAAGPLPTTAGSLALAGNVTNRDAPLVARLRAAGAVILGKTNLSEWANIRSNHSI
jgi:amidase